MPPRQDHTGMRAQQQAQQPVTEYGSPARVTEDLSDMLVRNPAPNGSPSREPMGIYRIIPASR